MCVCVPQQSTTGCLQQPLKNVHQTGIGRVVNPYNSSLAFGTLGLSHTSVN